MNVALYARVSKEDNPTTGQEYQNPENQLVPLRKYCEAMSWVVKTEYVDKASGASSDRPEFQRMLSDVKMRKFDIVLVWSLDRFSREGIMQTLRYIKIIREYKTALKSYQESWLDTREQGLGDLIISIISWAAFQERERISQRTKAALARKKAAGAILGRPLKCQECGYSHHPRKKHKGGVEIPQMKKTEEITPVL